MIVFWEVWGLPTPFTFVTQYRVLLRRFPTRKQAIVYLAWLEYRTEPAQIFGLERSAAGPY